VKSYMNIFFPGFVWGGGYKTRTSSIPKNRNWLIFLVRNNTCILDIHTRHYYNRPTSDNHIGGVMVSGLASSAVDRGFELRSVG